MRGCNSFLIIITSEDDKLAFKKQNNSNQRDRNLELKENSQRSILSLNFPLLLFGLVLYRLSSLIYNI